MSAPTTPLRCGIYCRVSTQQQSQEDKYSLATQEAECRAHAATQGWQVVEHYVVHEVGSAFKLAERDGLASLLEAVEARELDVLLCHDLDRLSRKQTHTAMVAERIEAAGARLAFVLSDFEQSSTGTFLRQARAFANELEREKFMERTKRGKAAAGKPQGFAPPPYGLRYTADKARYEPNPTTVHHLLWMFAQADAGLSLRQIGLGLEARGALPPYHGRKDRRSATGRNESTRWAAATVQRILEATCYTGEGWAFRLTVVERPGQRLATKGRTVRVVEHLASDDPAAIRLPEGTYPVLVDPALFARVQALLAGNRTESQCRDRDPQVGVLRRGFAVCGGCGRNLVVKPSKRGGPYYTCNAGGRWHCPAPAATQVDQLDTPVWERVHAALTRREAVQERLTALRTADPTGPELAALDTLVAGYTAQQAKLAKAIAMLEDEDATAPLVAELANVAKQRKQAEAERAAALAKRDAWQRDIADFEGVAAFCARVAEEAQALDWHGKRTALERLGARVRLYPAGAEVRWALTLTLRSQDGPTTRYLHTADTELLVGYDAAAAGGGKVLHSC